MAGKAECRFEVCDLVTYETDNGSVKVPPIVCSDQVEHCHQIYMVLNVKMNRRTNRQLVPMGCIYSKEKLRDDVEVPNPTERPTL